MGRDSPNPPPEAAVTPAALRARAQHVRALARGIAHDEASYTLHAFANELEMQAAALDLEPGDATVMPPLTSV